jgi:hypothetical protein
MRVYRSTQPYVPTKAIYYTRSDMWNAVSAPFGGTAKDPSERSFGGGVMKRWSK